MFKDPNPSTEVIHHRETESRSLSYVDEFKQIIKEHPGAIADFKKVIAEIEHRQDGLRKGVSDDNELLPGDVINIGEVEATVIDSENFRDQPAHRKMFAGDYLRVKISDHNFFVKKIPGYSENDLSRGAHEFHSSNILKEAVKDIPNVEVVDFQLGYHDKDNTYFVSKWIDGIRIKDYILSLKKVWTAHKEDDLGRKAREKVAVLRNRIDELRLKLPDFDDIGSHNAFYDEATDKITLFDIQRLDV